MTSAAVVYVSAHCRLFVKKTCNLCCFSQVIPTGPLTEGNKEDESVLDLKDVRIDVMRSSGAGGQVSHTYPIPIPQSPY